MRSVINWFLPKEGKFFDMLKEQSDNVLAGAEELKKFVFDYHLLTVHQRKEMSDNISKIEEKGDHIIHTIITELDKTLVTPFDKEDIHKLTGLLDDLLDYIDAVSERFIIFNINRVDGSIKKLVELLLSAVKELNKAISNLRQLKDMKEFHIKINSLENESDKIYYTAISSLFTNNKDPIDVIKYKDIYEMLENTLDKCEDITYVIENIVVKHA